MGALYDKGVLACAMETLLKEFGFHPRVRVMEAENEFMLSLDMFYLFQTEHVLPVDPVAGYVDLIVAHLSCENLYVVHAFSDLDVLTLTMSPYQDLSTYALRRWIRILLENKEVRMRTKTCVICWESIYGERDSMDDSVSCATCLCALCFDCYDKMHQNRCSHSPPKCPHCRTQMVTTAMTHMYNRELQLAYELPSEWQKAGAVEKCA